MSTAGASYWYLFPAALVFLLGSVLSYSRYRDANWFLPTCMAVWALSGYLWAVAVRRLRTTDEIYRLSLAWDVVVLGAYYFAPVLWADIRLTPLAWLGAAFVIFGIFLVKLGAS